MRAERVDEGKSLAVINKNRVFDLNTARQGIDIDRNLRGNVFLESCVHQIESDRNGGR